MASYLGRHARYRLPNALKQPTPPSMVTTDGGVANATSRRLGIPSGIWYGSGTISFSAVNEINVECKY